MSKKKVKSSPSKTVVSKTVTRKSTTPKAATKKTQTRKIETRAKPAREILTPKPKPNLETKSTPQVTKPPLTLPTQAIPVKTFNPMRIQTAEGWKRSQAKQIKTSKMARKS